MGETIYGKRVFLNVARPERSLVHLFQGIPSSNIGDMMNRLFNTNSEIKAFTPGVNLLGTAITVKAPEGDNAMFHYAIDIAQEGDIIVVDAGGGMSRSLCGEMMYTLARGKGIAGFVINGCIRDTDSLQNLKFPVYAKGVTPEGPWKYGPGEINVPVCCGGQVVFPGDILAGDADGIVVIRPEYAKEVSEAAKKKYASEIAKLNEYHSGNYHFDAHAATSLEWLEKMQAVRC